MKKTLTIAILTLAVLSSSAQTKPQFVYDVNFQYNLDNREFYAGDELYAASRTFNSARLTPGAGFLYKQDKKLTHKVMAGIDVLNNMGEYPVYSGDKYLDNWDLFHEVTFWYSLEADLRKARINGCAGMFPGRFSAFGQPFSSRNIPRAFVSDENMFYDPNIEGLLVNARREHAFYEIGLDWMGLYGSRRREQFRIFTYGKGAVSNWLNVGWVANFHHYASSVEYIGVVDDNLVSPFVEFDFKGIFKKRPEAFSVSFHYLQGIHQDRVRDTGLELSSGGEATLDVRNWGVGICNSLYYGTSQMPYYSLYSSGLYRGSPFYQVRGVAGNWKESGYYNRFEVYYQPKIASFLDLRISAVAHFASNASHSGYQGWQQKFSLVFNLEKALRKETRNPEHRLPVRMFDLIL